MVNKSLFEEFLTLNSLRFCLASLFTLERHCEMLSGVGKASKCASKVLIFLIEIETDYIITWLKYLLQNHNLLAMFHSKTTKKKAKFPLRWRCLLFPFGTVMMCEREPVNMTNLHSSEGQTSESRWSISAQNRHGSTTSGHPTSSPTLDNQYIPWNI